MVLTFKYLHEYMRQMRTKLNSPNSFESKSHIIHEILYSSYQFLSFSVLNSVKLRVFLFYLMVGDQIYNYLWENAKIVQQKLAERILKVASHGEHWIPKSNWDRMNVPSSKTSVALCYSHSPLIPTWQASRHTPLSCGLCQHSL